MLDPPSLLTATAALAEHRPGLNKTRDIFQTQSFVVGTKSIRALNKTTGIKHYPCDVILIALKNRDTAMYVINN